MSVSAGKDTDVGDTASDPVSESSGAAQAVGSTPAVTGKPSKKAKLRAVGAGGVVPIYEIRQKIYPRSVTGWFAGWRWAMVWLTQLFFYGVPWLTINGRQAVLFNLEARRFYIFGLVLNPQDFIYLAVLLVISAFSLFLFTAVAGRLWCGFTCPQTVYTEIMLWIERAVEGERGKRMKLDSEAMSARKLRLKATKHFLWISFSLWTGFTFVGYFTPIRELVGEVVTFALGPWQLFWILFYGLATYGNAGFLREQVCKYMCPYARFQGVMFDRDTLVITYDEKRGDPRGTRGRKVDKAAAGLGDCIDCGLCVDVCPTGIDIRKGLQYECIGCAACIDACDQVMDKMEYPRGLVRYDTLNSVEKGFTRKQLFSRVFRPRVLIYMGILAAIILTFIGSLATRTPLTVDVMRDRATLAREVEGGRIENVFRLLVQNKTEQEHTYTLSVSGLPGLEIDQVSEVIVAPTANRLLAIRVRVPGDVVAAGSHEIRFTITAIDDPSLQRIEESKFIVPSHLL